jgi:hypothetical protein
VDSDPADVVFEHLALSGVQPAADGETEAVELFEDLLGATNRAGGSVERREESVSGLALTTAGAM